MKCLRFLCTTLLLLCCVAVHAQDFEVDGIYYSTEYHYKGDTVIIKARVVKGSTECTGHIVIPSHVSLANNLSCEVVGIGYGAFRDCAGLTSVEIPNSVTSIGGYAFQGCSGLTNIEIPNSVTSIGGYAFHGTAFYDNLEDGLIYFGNILYAYKGDMPENTVVEIKDGTTCINPGAFDGYAELVEVIIPSSVTEIGHAAFRNCTSLTSVTLPNNITEISSDLFNGCTNLTNIIIPSKVTRIGSTAFLGCTNLIEVVALPTVSPTLDWYVFWGIGNAILTYPENSNYLSWGKYFSNFEHYEDEDEEWAIDDNGNAIVICKYPDNEQNTLDGYGGEKIIKAVYIEEGFTHIGGLIVNGDNCKYVEKVILPSTTQVIGDYAFNGYALTEIYLPEGLKEIGEGAFWGCRLKFVVIPSTVETIGNGAFPGYENEGNWIDPTVIFKTFNPPHIKDDLGGYNICVPEGGSGYDNVSQYFTAGKEYATGHFDDTGKTIFVFGDIYNMDPAETGWGFGYDDERGGYPRLDEADAIVFMPEVEGYERIRTMPNLKVVDVVEKSNSNNDSGYSDPFIYTVKGSNCIFWSSDGSLVAGCAASVIPEGTHSIASSAFYRSGLKEIVIPEGVNYIGNEAFYECTGLQEINIPESVQTIDAWAFSGCI